MRRSVLLYTWQMSILHNIYKYHRLPPAEEGNVAQVWPRGGSVPLFIAADIALAAIFPAQPPTFNLQWGIRGGLFAIF